MLDPRNCERLEDPEFRLGQAAVATRGLTKIFPGVVANDSIDFEVLRGEIHALLGENGSGKTTLCKSLTGLYQIDAGQIYVDGQRKSFSNPADAFAAGIFMVHQHFSLVDTLTVAENVVLGWSANPHWRYNAKEVEARVEAAARRFSIDLDPRAQVSSLTIGQKQKVELLKALYRGAKTLILDEPATVLAPQEADTLFQTLRHMADDGNSVIFISHKLNEVAEICDHVTVLRMGKMVGSRDLRSADIDAKALAQLMVGRDITLQRKTTPPPDPNVDPILVVRNISVRSDAGVYLLKNVTLEVRPGEILGVAGVAGNGQLALAETIAGLRTVESGDITIGGKPMELGNTRAAIKMGVAYIPEDRLGTGLAPGLRVSHNVVLKSYRNKTHSFGPFTRRRVAQVQSENILTNYKVKGSASSLIRQLSGGNAQKILLGRELSSDPTLLIVATPTRGLDVSSMEHVRELITAAAANGLPVVLLSEDLGELMDLADRIAVICGGEIQGVVDPTAASIDEIGLLMMGQRGGE